jgi:hypothetical protein
MHKIFKTIMYIPHYEKKLNNKREELIKADNKKIEAEKVYKESCKQLGAATREYYKIKDFFNEDDEILREAKYEMWNWEDDSRLKASDMVEAKMLCDDLKGYINKWG